MYIEPFSALFSMMTNEQMNLYSSGEKKSKKDFCTLLKYKITNIEDLEKLLTEMTSK